MLRSNSKQSGKSILVFPFWYRLTRVVPEKGPLNGCVCVCVLCNADMVIKCDVQERILNTLLLPFYQSYVSVYK